MDMDKADVALAMLIAALAVGLWASLIHQCAGLRRDIKTLDAIVVKHLKKKDDVIPFSVTFSPDGGTIILTGDLVNEWPAVFELESKLWRARNRSSYRVNASNIRLPVGGTELWTYVVSKFLANCELTYEASQLAQNLRYADNYRHAKSVYLNID